MESQNHHEKIIRLKEVKARIGLSRSTIYQWISESKFVKPIKIGHRSVGWIESEVNTWIQGKIEETRSSSNLD